MIQLLCDTHRDHNKKIKFVNYNDDYVMARLITMKRILLAILIVKLIAKSIAEKH